MLRAGVLVAALALSACADSSPTSYAGFRLHMSNAEAFELACEKMRNGELTEGPTLYVQGVRRPVTHGESICDLRDTALAADRWWLIEPGLRDKYIVLDFVDGELTTLQIKWRGWDP